MSSDRIHLSVDEARALGEGMLRGIGYDAEEAWIICDHVIDAALCGYEYSGLAKLLSIPEHHRFALPRVRDTRRRSAFGRAPIPDIPVNSAPCRRTRRAAFRAMHGPDHCRRVI